jgi:general secretion pathway protein J
MTRKFHVLRLTLSQVGHRLPTSYYSRGFTLLEVLVASTILSLVLAALYSVFSQTVTSKRWAEERATQARTTRVALLRISEDLQSALPLSTGTTRFTSETRPAREFPDDTLFFTTVTRTALSNHAPEGDQNEIGYTLEPDPEDISDKQLVRRVNFVLSPKGNSTDESVPLLPHVRGLRFRFFNGQAWQEEWRQENGQLPRAVETTVYLTDAQGVTEQFSAVVDLPLAEKKRSKLP